MTHIITLDGDIFNNIKTQREIKQWMVSFTVPLLTEHLPSTLVISRSPMGDTECGDQSPPACFLLLLLVGWCCLLCPRRS